MYLYIDTAEEMIISLYDAEANLIKSRSRANKHDQSEKLLQEINNLLAACRLPKNQLAGIIANLGPGSYTGLRVGLTTANFLSFGLGIPVFGINNGDKKSIANIIFEIKRGRRPFAPLQPLYLRPPRITHPDKTPGNID